MSTPVALRKTALEERSALLPTDPPPLIARGIASLIILGFALLLAAAVFIKIPETVRCAFVLVPDNGDDPVQAPYQAVVQTIHVAESQEVQEGAAMFTLRADEVRARSTRVQSMKEDLRSRQDISLKLDDANKQQLHIKDAELAQSERELEFRQQHVNTSRSLVTTLTKLHAVGGLSQVDLDRAKLQLAESEKDSNVTQKEVEAIRLVRHKMETDRERERAEETSGNTKLTLEITSLEASLGDAGNGLFIVRAPYHAVVASLEQRNVGNIVQPGTALCHLARLDSVPHAHMVVGEQGLPKIGVNQRVRLFFEAFPYQRYGTVTGRLDWLSPVTVTSEGGQHFAADASLDQREFRFGKETHPVRIGMRGEARIIVGSHTLIEYVFEPVHQLRENLQP